jgi:hypothetical protein
MQKHKAKLPSFIVGAKPLIILWAALAMLGCASMTPHQNFMYGLSTTIGQDIDNVPPYKWPHPEDFMNAKVLPNGNEEREYKYMGTCRLFFEVNLVTRKIVNARSEGRDDHCIIVP